DMEAAIPLSGQVCGRIDAVRPVGEVILEVRREFFEVVGRLANQYPESDPAVRRQRKRSS
ncbi:MAG: hypothetical protein OXF72_06325, partial [Gammaproteobacteria bacterium]|nr:hypothetical protein [Gammaproteobacteria bacterium]